MIDRIKDSIACCLNKKVRLKINNGRNKSEEYVGFICEVYDFIFVVRNELELRSFSYSDVLTKNVIIHYV